MGKPVKTIWKYPIGEGNPTEIVVPKYLSRLVHVGMQEGTLCVWIERYDKCIDNEPEETRKYWVVGTGFEVPSLGNYVGTAMDRGYAWHVYEEKDA